MAPALIILLAWLLFGGSHLLLSSSSVRQALERRHGPLIIHRSVRRGRGGHAQPVDLLRGAIRRSGRGGPGTG